MLKKLDFVLGRVLAWPEAAQEKLLCTIPEIEAQHGLNYSRFEASQTAPGRASVAGQVDFIADAATEAFFKRHSFWF